MKSKYPKYTYILAIIFGLISVFSPDMTQLTTALLYLVGGCIFGFLWPRESWRWGFWIVSPMVALIGLSVAFSGHLEIFLEKDLPIIIMAIVSACAGSFLVAWLKVRFSKNG